MLSSLSLSAADVAAVALLAISVFVFTRVILRLRKEGGRVPSGSFQISEALSAFILASYFVGSIITALSRKEGGGGALSLRQVIPNSLFFVFIAVAIGFYLKFLRGMSFRETFGILRMSPLKILGWAAGLLACAFPPIYFAAFLSQAALPKEDVVPQPLVQFFRDAAQHRDYSAIVTIIIAAAVFAPMCEEFIFRGFFYGVGKRFLGAVPAGFLTALFFAAFHLNLASLASLFILALCLTLAYERTGSLLVPICMHAAFNFLNLLYMFAQAQGWASSQ